MAVAGRTSANAGRLGGERSLGGPGMVLALHYADLFCVQASRFEGVTLRHYRLRYMAFKIGKKRFGTFHGLPTLFIFMSVSPGRFCPRLRWDG